MRPTITEMLSAAALRRIATLVPVLPRHLFTDADDLASTLAQVAPRLAPPLATAVGNLVCELGDIDQRTTTLDELQAVHQRALDLFDAALRDPSAHEPDVDQLLRAALERSVNREQALGASIAGR